MANEIKNVKEAILTWTYNQLNSRYPNNFKISEYTSTLTNKTKKAPNVYWINTITDRPELATECYLDTTMDQCINLGTDGEFYKNSTDNKYYTSGYVDSRVRYYTNALSNFYLTIKKKF